MTGWSVVRAPFAAALAAEIHWTKPLWMVKPTSVPSTEKPVLQHARSST